MKVNWYSKDQVIRYAQKLKGDLVVYKHPNRDNYNIISTDRTDVYKPHWVIFRTISTTLQGGKDAGYNQGPRL